MKTNVYVDGFNLYYGCLRGTPYRWLDIAKLCSLLLRSHDINRIRYFTARIQTRPGTPHSAQNQQTYLRALATIPNLSIHYGHYLSNPKRLPLVSPPPSGPQTVEVMVTEEKGSDVNLATYLLMDGFKKDYEQAVIISNDSDLKLPIQVVRNELGLHTGILNPQKNRSFALAPVPHFYRPIRKGALSASHTLSDSQGTITKPASW
jgi:hypothetical protein